MCSSDLDGDTIRDAGQLQDVMENSRVSQRLKVRISREGKNQVVTILPKELSS